jgi:hypothetical protein
MRFAAMGVLMLLSATGVSAQSRTGFFAGYTLASPDFHGSAVTDGNHLPGWVAGVDVVSGAHLGVVARVDADYDRVFRQGIVASPLGGEFRPSIYTFTAGPRIAVVTRPRMALFLDVLAGMAHVGAESRGVDARVGQTGSSFVAGTGGGFEVALQRTMDVAFDVQFRRTNLFGERLDLVQVGAALVVRPWRR